MRHSTGREGDSHTTAPVPQPCRGSSRAAGDQKVPAGPAQRAALGAEHALSRKLWQDRATVPWQESPLKCPRQSIPSWHWGSSWQPGMLCHIPLAIHIPLLCHSPHTQHPQLCICLFTIFQSPFFQEALSLNEFVQEYLKLFLWTSKQHSQNSCICEF